MSSKLSTLPHQCRWEAYHRFTEALPYVDTTAGLVEAAIALSMHALDDVEPLAVHGEIAALAERVNQRVHFRTENAVLAHFHDVLFEEELFQGNQQHYYTALNSYLPAVLVTRTGLPILLSLVYKAVGEQVGLKIDGINAPGHFLVRLHTQEGATLVDPYSGGALLTREEAFQRLDRMTGQQWPRQDRFLAPATNLQWLSRILANLIGVFINDNRQYDLAAMLELRQALEDARD